MIVKSREGKGISLPLETVEEAKGVLKIISYHKNEVIRRQAEKALNKLMKSE